MQYCQQKRSEMYKLAQSLGKEQKFYPFLCLHYKDANMASFFGREHRNIDEVIVCDAFGIAHNFLDERLVLFVHYLIDAAIIEVTIAYSMDAHEVLDDGVPHGVGRFDSVATILIISHFEGVFALGGQSFGSLWSILVEDTVSLVLPVEVCEGVGNLLGVVEVHVSCDYVCLVYGERVVLLILILIRIE